MRWCGMAVPGLYTRMAEEFEELVRSGDYAAWVAATQRAILLGRSSHSAGFLGATRPRRSRAAHSAPSGRRRSSARPRRLLLPGPIITR
jgi:hypothetical protein